MLETLGTCSAAKCFTVFAQKMDAAKVPTAVKASFAK